MGTLQQLGKGKERKFSARLQAVDGKWPKDWPPVTSTGRVGNLEEDKVPFDTLTANFAGEAKSSSNKAQNPGHRITKEGMQKVQAGAKKFGQRWVYMIDLPFCEKGHMVSERQHFRYLVMENFLGERWDLFDESFGDDMEAFFDAEIDALIDMNCEECHK